MNIIAWGNVAPWAEQRQIEQDLIISRAAFEQSRIAPKLVFHAQPEDGTAVPLRLKVEISTRETAAYDQPCSIFHAVENPWFTGAAAIPTYSREEMLATKMRALLQRDKGRDLFDLSHALTIFDGLDAGRVIEILQRHLAEQELNLSRAQAEERMFAKLNNPGFLADIRPLLAPVEAERLTDDTMKAAFLSVFTGLVEQLPENPWARTDEMTERFELNL